MPVGSSASIRDSAAWAGGNPTASVVVTTYGRSGLLDGLLDRLQAQTYPQTQFEVVVVDNGSTDATWTTLERAVAATDLRMRAVHLPENRGAGGGRNAARPHCRGTVVAFTDDDCLPDPAWLEALSQAVDGGADIVQGQTGPVDEARPRPWSRSVWIREPSWLYETCNIAYRRAVLDQAEWFGHGDALTGRAGDRAFGEDVLLGWRAVNAGARFMYAPAAAVRHRWVAGRYSDWLRELRQVRDFPRLVAACPSVRDAFWLRWFLSSRSAALDAGLVGVVAAAATRRPTFAAAAVPWLLLSRGPALARPGRPTAVRLAQLAVADLVILCSLVEGSIRSRRLVL